MNARMDPSVRRLVVGSIVAVIGALGYLLAKQFGGSDDWRTSFALTAGAGLVILLRGMIRQWWLQRRVK